MTIRNKLIFGFVSIVLLSGSLQLAPFESNSINFYLFGCALVVVSMIIAYVIIKSILNPIRNLNNIIIEIESRSDLSHRIEIKNNDEIAKMAHAFNNMLDKFQAFVQQVNSSSAQLTAAAEQVSSIANQSTAQVQSQLTETDQVATAMNEMAATVQEVARNATDAATAATNADSEATSGRDVVQHATTTIKQLAIDVDNAAVVIRELDEHSDSIGAVLDVIRGIAEQTNLLALNAAIEAARAGEQGRGFAVVADEVRTLASRTQESTEEINAMIEKLQSGAKSAVHAMEKGRLKAQEGAQQAGEAVTSLQAITSAVSIINDMNTQIAGAAVQQNAVTEEMNRNITNISQISLQTSEGAANTEQASNELARLSGDLHQLVAQFKI